MAKNFKRVFAIMMSIFTLATISPLQALAEEGTPAVTADVTVDKDNGTVEVNFTPADSTNLKFPSMSI